MIILKILIACLLVYVAIGAAWEHTEYRRMELMDFIRDVKEWLKRKR